MAQSTEGKAPSAAQTARDALAKAEEARMLSQENNRLLRELHAGLMQPLPGYSKSFVERATEVVVEAEAGKIVGEKLVWYGKVLTALGVIGASIYAAMNWGTVK